MRVLLDANVLPDVGLHRLPLFEPSEEVLTVCLRTGEAAMAWHSVAVVAYFMKADDPAFIEKLMRRIDVAEVGRKDVQYALSLGMPDSENALQVAAAIAFGAEAIVSRDKRHFSKSPVPRLTPEPFLARVGAA